MPYRFKQRQNPCSTWILVAAAALILACSSLSAGVSASKPNIVFVLFDDMGWSQPPSYRAESALRTPHLDRLAQQGMRFTDAHSASAVCTPTRYGLLTGRYPARIGQFGVLTTYSAPIIPPSRMTVASLLKQHGYATACIGKWHLGLNWVDGKPGNEKQVPIGAKTTDGPNAIGFDYFYGAPPETLIPWRKSVILLAFVRVLFLKMRLPEVPSRTPFWRICSTGNTVANEKARYY